MEVVVLVGGENAPKEVVSSIVVGSMRSSYHAKAPNQNSKV